MTSPNLTHTCYSKQLHRYLVLIRNFKNKSAALLITRYLIFFFEEEGSLNYLTNDRIHRNGYDFGGRLKAVFLSCTAHKLIVL